MLELTRLPRCRKAGDVQTGHHSVNLQVRSVLDGQDLSESLVKGCNNETSPEGAADNTVVDASTDENKPQPEMSGVEEAASHLSSLGLHQPGTVSDQATPDICGKRSSPQKLTSPVGSLIDSDFQTQPGNMRPQGPGVNTVAISLTAGVLLTKRDLSWMSLATPWAHEQSTRLCPIVRQKILTMRRENRNTVLACMHIVK
jgi:hypothetical protein